MSTIELPSLFGTVLGALTTLDRELPEGTKDDDVYQKLQEASTAYSNLIDATSKAPDYSSPVARIGYVFTYVAAHAGFMQEGLDWAMPQLANTYSSDYLTVTSFGGGPGSDLLGLFSHLLNQRKYFDFVSCKRADRENEWARAAELLLTGYADRAMASFEHVHLDLANPDSYSENLELFASHLFLASYLLSELIRTRTDTNAFFTLLGQEAEPGSVFIVLDSASNSFIPHYDQMLALAGFARKNWSCVDARYDDDCEKLNGFAARYKRSPKMNGQIYFGIYQKS